MKYSKEYKLECIRKHKNGERVEYPPDIKRECFYSSLITWVHIYDSLGEAGFEHGRPSLSLDQKLELIKRVESGESYSSVGFSAGIYSSLLGKWHRLYKEFGIDGLKSLKRGRRPSMEKMAKKNKNKSELDRLREENEYLRAENEYLKKLSALVQERKARQRKKKYPLSMN